MSGRRPPGCAAAAAAFCGLAVILGAGGWLLLYVLYQGVS